MKAGRGLGGIQVGEVMDREPDIVGPEMTIADAVFGHLLQKGTRALPVCRNGRLLGIITLTDVECTSRDEWRSLTVMDRMTSTPLLSLKPDDELARAVEVLAENSLNQAPVLEGNQLVGMLTRADIILHLYHRGERGLRRWPPSAGDAGR